jgi:hypothetical protein
VKHTTQYERIFRHLKQHRTATVRDLLAYSNCPHKRLAEMTDGDGWIVMFDGVCWGHEPYRLAREQTVRGGKTVRLYRLVRG